MYCIPNFILPQTMPSTTTPVAAATDPSSTISAFLHAVPRRWRVVSSAPVAKINSLPIPRRFRRRSPSALFLDLGVLPTVPFSATFPRLRRSYSLRHRVPLNSASHRRRPRQRMRRVPLIMPASASASARRPTPSPVRVQIWSLSRGNNCYFTFGGRSKTCCATKPS